MASYCICSKCHPLMSLSDYVRDQQQQQQQQLRPVQLASAIGGSHWCMLADFQRPSEGVRMRNGQGCMGTRDLDGSQAGAVNEAGMRSTMTMSHSGNQFADESQQIGCQALISLPNSQGRHHHLLSCMMLLWLWSTVCSNKQQLLASVLSA